MIPFFPKPFPDESMYNIVGRFSDRTKIDSYYQALEMLTNSTSTNLNYAYMNKLNMLCSQYPLGMLYQPEYFIINHTTLPFYKSFIYDTQYNEFYEYLVGISKNPKYIPKADRQVFRYCTHCMMEDKAQYFQSYIHRIHQVDGYLVCHKHNCALQEKRVLDIKSGGFQRINNLNYSTQALDNQFMDNSFKGLLALSIEFNSLINNYNILPTYEETIDKYKSKLYSENLISKSGRINYIKLYDMLLSKFDVDTLNKANAYYEFTNQKNWLYFILKKPQSPVRNLIFIKMIFSDFASFLSFKDNSFKGALCFISGSDDTKRTRIKYDLEETYKETILRVKNEGVLRRREVQTKYVKEYTWLEKHNKEWLIKNLPEPLPRLYYPHKTGIDWALRDEETRNKLSRYIEEILSNSVKTRITMKLMSDKLGYKLPKVLHNLPKTRELCDKYCENIEEFQIRKIKIVIQDMVRDGASLFLSTILREAGIGKNRYHDYDAFIHEIIRSYER